MVVGLKKTISLDYDCLSEDTVVPSSHTLLKMATNQSYESFENNIEWKESERWSKQNDRKKGKRQGDWIKRNENWKQIEKNKIKR